MTSGGRQRRDGSSKRVQLTSGDHGGPKDKKSKGRRKTSGLDGKASHAARLREVERFRDSIRAAEQRRTAHKDSPEAAPPADVQQHTPAQAAQDSHPIEGRADADTVLQVHLAACIQAAQDQNWALLSDHARHLAEAAEQLNAQARAGESSQQQDDDAVQPRPGTGREASGQRG
ncbi:hypothetical protein [Streptomyces sp. AC495_CC817]|uniref:hypothetical protein n=1 Tax=Streptomyces sp. AC495_CC817 TaxID=2823900 RepID=UPI001C2665C2|nr:hypothetical protein [Streptomyces sp. AC495_CC817]